MRTNIIITGSDTQGMCACVCVCVYEFQEHAQALGIKEKQREASDVFFSCTHHCCQNSAACMRACVSRTIYIRVIVSRVVFYGTLLLPELP